MSFSYMGEELAVFREAIHWKRYVVSLIGPQLLGDVLEVGAGIGSTTGVLCDGSQSRWLCLEPDRDLARYLEGQLRHLPSCCAVAIGTTSDLAADDVFDTVLYMDTLEHVQDDAEELRRVARHLRPHGRIIVLAPAHQWLYTPFDAAIGHFRRYSVSSLRSVAPPDLIEERLLYLDTAGLIASAGNRLFLRSATPTLRQVRFWDRVLVRASRILDRALGFRFGKSVLGVWRRREEPAASPAGPSATS